MCSICWNDETFHGVEAPDNASGCHLVDWTEDQWPIDRYHGSAGHARQAVQYCEPVEVGADSQYVNDFYSSDASSWPDPGSNRLNLDDLPDWLKDIAERDERAALAAQETVLAPEKELVGAV